MRKLTFAGFAALAILGSCASAEVPRNDFYNDPELNGSSIPHGVSGFKTAWKEANASGYLIVSRKDENFDKFVIFSVGSVRANGPALTEGGLRNVTPIIRLYEGDLRSVLSRKVTTLSDCPALTSVLQAMETLPTPNVDVAGINDTGQYLKSADVETYELWTSSLHWEGDTDYHSTFGGNLYFHDIDEFFPRPVDRKCADRSAALLEATYASRPVSLPLRIMLR